MATLEAGEAVLRAGNVTWVGPPGPRPGRLSVTNHALLFEGPIARRPRPGEAGFGMGRPMVEPGELRIPLWRCRSATVATGPRGPVLEVDLLARRVFFRCEDAASWATAINRARASAPPVPPGALERAGRMGAPTGPAPVRCDYCAHLSAPTATKCETCGAPF
jgi:hypothetical protein